jgi:hypothetical protein
MRPILVNPKQKVAVLASGLAIATTGFVTSDQGSSAGDPRASGGDATPIEQAVAGTEHDRVQP